MSLALKMGLTQRALHCGSLKELAARFRAVNPRTAFEVERARKWVRGVARPRDHRFYEDWAMVIGSGRGGAWIAAASRAAFVDELVDVLAADRAALEAILSTLEERRAAAPAGPDPASGSYVTYSHAYSRYYWGSLVRGVLRIAPRPEGRYDLTYREKFQEQGVIVVRGRAELSDGLLSCHAKEPDAAAGAAPFLFLLRTPGHPPHVLFGQMLAAAAFGPEREPGASPFVALRVGDAAAARTEDRVCYLDATEAAIARDLGALDLPRGAVGPLTAAMARVFGASGTPIITTPFAEFADACTALVRASGSDPDRAASAKIDA